MLGGCGEAPARRAVLVTVDTLRADHLGAYGQDLPVSPEIDAFAREAVVFDAAYSTAPLTGPAVASLMSGRAPDEIGVARGNRSLLPADVVTLAERLSEAGIATAAFVSNYVLRRPDARLGDVGVAQGFGVYDDRMETPERNRKRRFERLAEDTTDAALDWLEGRRERGEDRFFLWVHYQDPHGPYTPGDELATRFARAGPEEPALAIATDNRGRGALPLYQLYRGERRPSGYRARYAAEIHRVDREVGRLFGALKDAAWWDETLVVFTADHGESLGEHDYWFSHGEHVYGDVVRVPLILRAPRGAPRPGSARSAAPVGHLDVYPTVLAAFGLPAGDVPGHSLLTDALPETRIQPQVLDEEGAPGRWLGVSDGRWRLVVPGDGPAQLYDLRDDPAEERDLAEEETARVKELLARYDAWRARRGAPIEATETPLGDVEREALEHLGYLAPADATGEAP